VLYFRVLPVDPPIRQKATLQGTPNALAIRGAMVVIQTKQRTTALAKTKRPFILAFQTTGHDTAIQAANGLLLRENPRNRQAIGVSPTMLPFANYSPGCS
jgi:hypothetical protein